MTDVRAAKDALARLVDSSPVATAERAIEDVDRAAEFVDRGGLARLRRAVARADGARARRGRAALSAFERYQRAAAGEPIDATDQFRRGRGTPIGAGGQPRDDDTGDPHR
ncbi:hypothetical protein [Halorarius halobius]|uniref:hypothetical protein n=1 Tax=Halorarius halobius TaxID=2962671 RepID=UPI0020CCCF42|nr:hypothetical protein [Halorarius halobius]